MHSNGQPLEAFDFGLFDQNRNQFPSDQLLSFTGQFVAWKMDGTRILTSGQSREEVDQKLADMNIHFSQVVHDYIDPLLG